MGPGWGVVLLAGVLQHTRQDRAPRMMVKTEGDFVTMTVMDFFLHYYMAREVNAALLAQLFPRRETVFPPLSNDTYFDPLQVGACAHHLGVRR
jgi:hypothetical protein